ncbi:MAG: Rab family GTPase [Promethearchaeota archaeon]
MPQVPILKVFVCGEGGVGKTTLIERLMTNKFNAHTLMTIGVQHSLYKVETTSGKKISLQIWDLGGEDRFRVIIPLYIRGSSAGIIAFDESRYSTFKNLPEWLEIIKKEVDKDAPLILISTKVDLVNDKGYKEDELKEIMEKYNITEFIRTSSKTGLNIEKPFKTIANLLEKSGKI